MRRHHGDSFSRNGSGGSKQDEIGRTIYERMDKMLYGRWMLLCPFDVVQDPIRDLFCYAMSHEERQAWDVLRRNKGFAESIRVNSSFDVMHEKAGFCITIYVSKGIPNWNVEWDNLPGELAERLLHWQIQSRAYRDEYHFICSKVRLLLRTCSTPGQLERVWPQLLGFMPPETIDKRIDKKAQSPYPDGVLLRGEHREILSGVLRPEWKPEALAWHDNAIAEALILPAYEKPDGAPNYPEIHDL